MRQPASMTGLEQLGRVRLSKSFFMRDFLYSEISNHYGIPNIPDDPDLAIEAGKQLCEEILEPLNATFGRIAVRSAYRSCAVNGFGAENKLNCGSNERNFAAHIWDRRDKDGYMGATACIAIPWFADRYEQGVDWRALAWWIHDHLPYSRMCFFPKLAAFNINWHERPVGRIDSFVDPKGCLTKPGMDNHEGDHANWYEGFPRFVHESPHQAPAPSKRPSRSPQYTKAPKPMTAHKAIFTGFDSAWTDNPKKPGAIASIILGTDGRHRLLPPEPATFSHAREAITRLASQAPLHIVGIDQPTIVPNLSGSRPVDKVVASLISKMKGGVQPANRGKVGMFDDDAPIWRLLGTIPHRQFPAAAIGADCGQVVIEVFPALAILGLFPRYVERGWQPKYNPEHREKFDFEDWRSLASELAEYGTEAGIADLPEWADTMLALARPGKADQDAVDAVICAIQAFHWWRWGYDKSALIGDENSGYIVGATNDWTMDYLKAQAEKRSVSFQHRW